MEEGEVKADWPRRDDAREAREPKAETEWLNPRRLDPAKHGRHAADWASVNQRSNRKDTPRRLSSTGGSPLLR